MEKFLKYIIAVLILYILYNMILKDRLPINDIYLFIGLGLLIFFIFNKIIEPIYNKKFEHYKNIHKKKRNIKEETFEESSEESSAEHFQTMAPAPVPIQELVQAPAPVPIQALVQVQAPAPVPMQALVQAPAVVSNITGTITPIGTIQFLAPTPAPINVTSVLSNQAVSLTADQIKNLSASDREQLIKAYLLDVYKKNPPSSIAPYALSEGEVVYYVGLFVSSSNDPDKMSKIRDNISAIQKIDAARGLTLIKLMSLSQINPELSIKVAATTPYKLIDIVNVMDSSVDFSNLIVNASNKDIQLELIKLLQSKIISLEKTVLGEVESKAGKEKIPDALMEIIGKNKYVDSRGMIQDLTYGDLKFNTQLSAGQMQALGSYDSTFNNKWDNTYTLLNTDKWRPPQGKVPVCKQDRECPVCPSLTSGYPLSLMEYDKSRYIMGPDGISSDYIKQLNNPYKS
jgi:hypothetical protein